MAYRVKTESFEGPFGLLLHLVTRRKVDIGSIDITQIADDYLAYLERMDDVDLDIASDFLVVASQLLALKAAALLPPEEREPDPEFEDLSPEDTREILIARLLAYKQIRNAAAALGSRMDNEARMHPRTAGIDEGFVQVLPDYLQGVSLRGLAVICADLAARRDIFLLEADHIAPLPIPLEVSVREVYESVLARSEMHFSELVAGDARPPMVVVTLLALLELYKRNSVTYSQEDLFGDIIVRYLGPPTDGFDNVDASAEQAAPKTA